MGSKKPVGQSASPTVLPRWHVTYIRVISYMQHTTHGLDLTRLYISIRIHCIITLSIVFIAQSSFFISKINPVLVFSYF